MILYFFRALILYIALIIVVRLMGKRQVGEMEPVELVVAMLIAGNSDAERKIPLPKYEKDPSQRE